MTNRREFLKAATALSAAPLVGRTLYAAGLKPVALDAVIFDVRHAEARNFGASAVRHGVSAHAIAGDITSLWQNKLLNMWQGGTAVIAGLTERPALFLLERLAWDYGLRVVFEGEHTPDGSGTAAHHILRTADQGLMLELETAGRHWPAVLADALLAGSNTTRDFRPSDAALAAYLGEPARLYSWVIAPRTAT